MAKYLLCILAIMFVMASVSVATPADEPVGIVEFWDGDRGEFDLHEAEFAIMKPFCDPNEGSFGTVGGIITKETVVRVLNKVVPKESIDLLSGKQVVVMGKFRREGRGEGTKVYCLSLTIMVLEPAK